MATKELRKLNRAELLELLVAQTERADHLAEELQEAKEQIRNREDLIRQAGELASAAAKLINMLEGESGAAVQEKVTVAHMEQAPVTASAKPALETRKPAGKPEAPAAKEPAPVAAHAKPAPVQPGSWAEAIRNVNRENAQRAATQKKKSTKVQIKDTKHEKNGIDPSAIIAITSGIGKGKI